MDYVKSFLDCLDGKLIGFGYLMGGIILYVMLGICGKSVNFVIY